MKCLILPIAYDIYLTFAIKYNSWKQKQKQKIPPSFSLLTAEEAIKSHQKNSFEGKKRVDFFEWQDREGVVLAFLLC